MDGERNPAIDRYGGALQCLKTPTLGKVLFPPLGAMILI